MADPFEFDDEDEKPTPKKRKPRDDEDDAPPKKKRPVQSDDDEDERPKAKAKAKSKRDDDDEDEDDVPAKKKKGGGGKIILIVLGVLFVVCGGGCGGIYWFVVKPIVNKTKEVVKKADEFVEDVKNTSANPKVTPENAKKIKSGMSASEVEEILGKPQTATSTDIDIMCYGNMTDGDETTKRWEPKANDKQVLVWHKYPDHIAVAFSVPAEKGGTVVGVLGTFTPNPNKSAVTTEHIKLPGAVKDPPTDPIPPKDPTPPTKDDKTSNLSASAKALMGTLDIHNDKWVRVSAKIDKVIPPADDKPAILELENGVGMLSGELDTGFWKADKFHPGDEVVLLGKVTEEGPKTVRLLRCDLVNHTFVPPSETVLEVKALDFLEEAIQDDKAAFTKYSKKVVKVTGVVEKIPTAGALQLTGKSEGGITYYITILFPFDSRVGLSDVKVGDTVSIIGTVSAPPTREVLLSQNGKTKSILLTKAKLAK